MTIQIGDTFPDATRDLDRNWSLFARATHTWCPSEISDSPIVERSQGTGIFVGLGWSPK